MGTRQPRLLRLATLATIISVVAFQLVCRGTTTPDPPDPPIEKVKILTTVSATYVFSGNQASGTVMFQPSSGGTAVSGALGVQTDLGEIAKDVSRHYDITIEAADALKRVFKSVPLTGTQRFVTTVLELGAFDIGRFCNDFLVGNGDGSTGWHNGIWSEPGIHVYFNPDPQTGERLPEASIAEIEKAILEITGYSNAFVTALFFHRDGDKPGGITPYPGEIYVYHENQRTGISNTTWPLLNIGVWAATIYVNPESSSISEVRKGVMDAFVHGDQVSLPDESVSLWFKFSFGYRPKDQENYSYLIFLDHEEQTGVDRLSTLQSTGEVPVHLFPGSVIGQQSAPGQTTPQRLPNIAPARPGTARPAPKDRIRN